MKYLLALLPICLCACVPNYSDGVRSGTITKLSNKGLFFKSWEGQINLGGMRSELSSDGKSSSMVPNIDCFNIPNSRQDLIALAQSSMTTGKTVEISYDQWFISPVSIGCDTVIKGIK